MMVPPDPIVFDRRAPSANPAVIGMESMDPAFQRATSILEKVPTQKSKFDTEMQESVTMSVSATGVGYIEPDRFSRHYFNHPLHSNQKDSVAALISDARTTQVIQPRQSGKTSAVAVACAINIEREGAQWNRANAEPYRIGIFAPKLGQAEIDISRLKGWARCTPNGRALINWRETTNTRIVWHDGSEILAFSASDQAENEGKTLNRIILEEGQKISDHVVSEVIMPMGGATNAKIAKIGSVRPIQNHFWRTWHEDRTANKVWHHWMICENYFQGGYLEHNSRRVGRYILDMMPVQIKEFYIRAGIFPNDPDWLYQGQLEYGDFLTQYELRWLEQFGLFLSMDERGSLFSGNHNFIDQQTSIRDELYAGIDFATGTGQDETAISVWRRNGLIKERVWFRSFNDLDMPEQGREIRNLFGKGGKFYKVKLILGDIGGNGLAVIQHLAQEDNIPIQPVNFGANDKRLIGVKMNMKTSMFMDFKRECQMGTARFGQVNSSTPMEEALEYKKGVRQWSALEQQMLPSGLNRKIQAPESDHDDIPCADVLAIRAAKLGPQMLGTVGQRSKLGVLPHFLITNQSPVAGWGRR